MRLLLCFCFCLLLPAQSTLDINPASPRVDVAVTFTLGGVVPISVTWDPGDGSAPFAGGVVAVYTYRKPGAFLARATYDSAGGSGSAQRALSVVEPRVILVQPAAPEPGQPTTFQGRAFLGQQVQWFFGDGTAPILGSEVQGHTFDRPGVFDVRATDLGGGAPREFRQRVIVGGQGPNATFSLSFLRLRWEDGTFQQSTRQGDSLVAYADLKAEGTGILQAQWVVDDQPLQSLSQPITFAGQVTLVSPPLPTLIPGEHRLSFRVLQPRLLFESPEIRFFVQLSEGQKGPRLLSVKPSRMRIGEEVELRLSGQNFTQEMQLHAGRDIALVTPLQVDSAESARIRVFIGPSAKPGIRTLKTSREANGPQGTATLDVLPALRRPGRKR